MDRRIRPLARLLLSAPSFRRHQRKQRPEAAQEGHVHARSHSAFAATSVREGYVCVEKASATLAGARRCARQRQFAHVAASARLW